MCCWEVKRKTLWSRHWDIIKVKTPFHLGGDYSSQMKWGFVIVYIITISETYSHDGIPSKLHQSQYHTQPVPV